MPVVPEWYGARTTGVPLVAIVGAGQVLRFYTSNMTRWTIELDDEVAERVAREAAERGVAPEALAGEVVTEHFPVPRKLSFIGIGASGQRGESVAERRKEIRRTHFADKTASDV